MPEYCKNLGKKFKEIYQCRGSWVVKKIEKYPQKLADIIFETLPKNRKTCKCHKIVVKLKIIKL